MKAAQITQAVGSLSGQTILLSSRTFVQNLLATYYTTGGISPDDSNLKQAQLSVESTDDVMSASLYSLNLNQVVSIPSLTEDNVTFPDDLYPARFMSQTDLSNVTTMYQSYVLGPVKAQNHFYMSFTRLVTQNTADFAYRNIIGSNATGSSPTHANIGYITVITRAKPLFSVIKDSTDFPGNMALVQLERGNKHNQPDPDGHYILAKYVLPTTPGVSTVGVGAFNSTFVVGCYKDIGFLENSVGSFIDHQFPFNPVKQSGGYAPAWMLNTRWTVIIFQTHQVIYGPLYRLRNMLLIAVFSIGVGMFIGTLFLSSWAVKPILRLQSATEQSANTSSSASVYSSKGKRVWYRPWLYFRRDGSGGGGGGGGSGGGGSASGSGSSGSASGSRGMDDDTSSNTPPADPFNDYYNKDRMMDQYNVPDDEMEKKSLLTRILIKLRLKKDELSLSEKLYNHHLERKLSATSTGFRIPERVSTRRRIKDELTDLTEKFNEMTDELRRQYSILEERVIERTQEIETARLSAESANEAKSLFIANITHELRTPLNGILGMTAVSMDEEDPKRIQESLKIIFKSGELLLHLLTDLLTFSKNQVGNLDLEEKEFMIPEALTQLNAIFGEQSRTAQINLSIVCVTEGLTDLVFYGDINRILQIVINLISNSLKFTPKGGSVNVTISGIMSSHVRESVAEESGRSTISSRRTPKRYGSEGSGFARDNYSIDSTTTTTTHDSKTDSKTDNNPIPDDETATVIFSVSDTGPGIAPHLQGRIFEAFVQGDLAVAQRKGGAGLGLSICRQLATLMGGTVELTSELGKGSTFTFKVPLHVVTNGSKYIFADLSTVKDWPEYEVYNFDTIERRAEEAVEDVNLRMSSRQSTTTTTTTTTSTTAASITTTCNEYVPPPPANSRVSSSNSVISPQSTHSHRSIEFNLDPHQLLQQQQSNSKEVPRRPPIARSTSHRSREDEKKINFPVSVLVAEDNKVNQEVMIRMLKLEGIENITIANDGLEAISKLEAALKETENGYDIIFMDVQMPNLDGIEATRNIRNEIHYSGPIVAVSAFADSSNIDDCLGAGMNHFLAKPLRRPHLHRLLLSVLIKENEEEASSKEG